MFRSKSNRVFVVVVFFAAFFVSRSVAANPSERWIGTWSTALFSETKAPAAMTADGIAVRDVVHISAGGSSVRFKFSNEFGIDPLTLGEAAFALLPDNDKLQGEAHPITFGGKEAIAIPQGAVVLSDPIQIPLKALTNLSISIFLPQQQIRSWTRHQLAMQKNFIAPGNQVSAVGLLESTTITSSFFLKSVDVNCAKKCAAIVAVGDSITDGLGSAMGQNRRWPDVLAARLAADPKAAGIAVINEGISGNRLLHESAGPAALSRLDRDALTQSGVKFLILLEGINDIGVATRPKDPADPVTVEDLEWGVRQIVARAHDAGVKVLVATLTPAGRRGDSAENMRLSFNQWIRTCGLFDCVIDFDQAVRDPQNPRKMLQEADSGDSLHPGDNGYKRMGEAIDLKYFVKAAAH